MTYKYYSAEGEGKGRREMKAPGLREEGDLGSLGELVGPVVPERNG